MALTFQDLTNHIPPGSIEFVGQNQLKLNFNQLTEKELSFDEPLLEGVSRFFQALVDLTESINAERARAEPPLPPIVFASRELAGTIDQPIFRFNLDIRVNADSFMDNLLDPTT